MGPEKPALEFPHRHNPDGSCDSICSKCFVTVATSYKEAELLAHELKHVCHESWLLEATRPPSRQLTDQAA
jgi:hypothetical protein